MGTTNASIDIKELKALQQRIEKLQKTDIQKFCNAVSKELAARLLAKVIKRTPVGQYPAETGKVGGTLRRGWTGGKGQNAVAYAQSLPVKKSGNTYEITIINPVEYASFVEYGHRQTPGRFVPAIGKRLKQSWVEGKFFLTRSEIELEGEAQKIIEKKLLQYLEEAINGK